MTIISSGWQQLAFNMPSIRAEAILPNPRNPKVMCEREVIRLPAGCKGGEWASGRVGVVLVGGGRRFRGAQRLQASCFVILQI
jgi:hypothetical protein